MSTPSTTQKPTRFKTNLTIGIITLIGLGALLVPRHVRHDVVDAISRQFLPALDEPINGSRPLDQDDVIAEYRARGFPLKCYGNLQKYERITPNDDFHCWTVLKSAFDGVPARSFRLWFHKKRLYHVRYEFQNGTLPDIHAFLERSLTDAEARHKDPKNTLGVDANGYPLLAWHTRYGVVAVNSVEGASGTNYVLWTSWESYQNNRVESFLEGLKKWQPKKPAPAIPPPPQGV